MDIHRCRFIPYVPHAINAVAFSHPSSLHTKGKGPSTLRLAVGRANGDLELWNPLKGDWVQETIFRGGKDRSIEGIAWTQDPEEEEEDQNDYRLTGRLRLFSHGYSTAITEWDLERGRPARHSHGDYGEIWCLAAQPRWHDSDGGHESEFKGQHLAAGCADGAIVIFSTDDGDLRFKRTLTRPSAKRARVLSITFQNRNTIVAGYADSTIRVFDIRNGQLLRNMSLGSGPYGRKADILVWSVRALPDGTIVSGDSSGELRFWDASNYTLFQRIQSHKADVLDIVASADGETLMSGGADTRTILYQLKGGSKGDKRRRWVELMHRRFHSHDVKAMAVYETKLISVVASGGLDTTPIIIPLREFNGENHRTLSNLPQIPQTSSSPTSRLVMSWWDREIHIWRIAKTHYLPDSSGEEVQTLVSRILVQGEENITSASMSEKGNLLAVSTGSEVRLFNLRPNKHDPNGALKIRKITIPSVLASAGARVVQISPDTRWLLVVQANTIRLLRIFASPSSRGLFQVLEKPIKLNRLPRQARHEKLVDGSLGNYSRTIHCAAFSTDSRIVAVADLSGYIDTWVLEGHEDLDQDRALNGTSKKLSSSASSSSGEDSSDDESHDIVFGQRWLRNPAGALLPRLDAFPLFLSFRPEESEPSSKDQTDGAIALHPTRHNPTPLSHDLPIGEDRLLVVTSENHLFELSVLRGELSAWSRRNPGRLLPSRYADIRDRALGCVWDIGHHRERVWLFGHAFLCMIDLTKDFPPATDPVTGMKGMKRKRETDDGVKSRKHESGAGYRKPKEEVLGVGTSFRRGIGAKMKSGQVLHLGGRSIPDTDDDEEEVNDTDLAQLRREEKPEGGENGVQLGHTGDGDESRTNGLSVAKKEESAWTTHRYRNILGLLPLTTRPSSEHPMDNSTSFESPPLEVCLVERPKWDLGLPPSYDGDRERDR